MKFLKRYHGSDLRSLLELYVRDCYNPEFKNRSYENTITGAKAELI